MCPKSLPTSENSVLSHCPRVIFHEELKYTSKGHRLRCASFAKHISLTNEALGYAIRSSIGRCAVVKQKQLREVKFHPGDFMCMIHKVNVMYRVV